MGIKPGRERREDRRGARNAGKSFEVETLYLPGLSRGKGNYKKHAQKIRSRRVRRNEKNSENERAEGKKKTIE